MIGSILSHAGHRTGVYTSPHLVDFRERISINGAEISDEDLAGILGDIKPIAERMRSDKGSGSPTYFEVTTAAALLYFARQKVDFAVVEVGLGGRLDATNVVDPPLVAIITSIGLEHTDFLGTDIESIAAEKAEIIKKGCSVVTACDGEALGVIERKCVQTGSPLRVAGRDMTYTRKSSSVRGTESTIRGEYASYYVRLPVPGDYQIRNACCAVAAAEILKDRGTEIGRDDIEKGLSEARLDGRFQIAGTNPMLILDGAHNPDGMANLAEAIGENVRSGRVITVFSACSDKDISGMLKQISRVSDVIIATQHGYRKRSEKADVLAEMARKYNAQAVSEPTPEAAVRKAREAASAEDMILVTGSLYLVGDVKRMLILP